MALAAGLLACIQAIAGPASLDGAAWLSQRREAFYQDASREVALARAEFFRARQQADESSLRRWGSWYLEICAGRRLAPDLQTVYDALTESVEGEARGKVTGGLTEAWLGMARFEITTRQMDLAAQRIQLARERATTLGPQAFVWEAKLMSAYAQLESARAAGATAELIEVLQGADDPFQKIEARSLLVNAAMSAASSPAEFARVVEQAREAQAEMNALKLPWAALTFTVWEANTLARAGNADSGMQLLQQHQRELAQQGMDASAVILYRLSRSADLGLALAKEARRAPKDSLCAALVSGRLTAPEAPGSSISLKRLTVLCRAALRDPDVMSAIRDLERDAARPFVTTSAAFEESLWSSIMSAYALQDAHDDAYRSALRYRLASLRRVADANEAARAELDTKYQATAQRRENDHLRASQTIEAQQRLVLQSMLALLAVALGIAAVSLRIQTRHKRRLAKLSEQLVQANDSLTRLHASRNRLIAAACHDLRQPAHAIGLVSEVLSYGAPKALASSVDELRRAGAVLSDMLDVMIDMAQLESDRYELRTGPVAMDDLLLEVRAQFARVAERKGLALLFQAPAGLVVLTDRHLLRRMLFNLVSNGIKYTRRGHVQVRCEPASKTLRIVIEETGVGIPADKQQEIFSEFVRLDELRHDEQGLGIGLSVVARAARLLGAEVSLQSRVGQGSAFSVELPLASADAGSETTVSQPNRSLRIVVLEDDAAIRRAMIELLQINGHVAHECSSLDQLDALALAEPTCPDLVITDLHLGASMDGLQVIEHLRALPGWRRLPALLLTGDLDGEIASRAAMAGVVVAYKPLPARRLFELMMRAVSTDAAPFTAAPTTPAVESSADRPLAAPEGSP